MKTRRNPIGAEQQIDLLPLEEIKPTPENIARLVHYEVFNTGQRWQVAGFGGRRSGQIGVAIGTLALKHAGGYEVVLRFPDGKIDTFAPMSLFPA